MNSVPCLGAGAVASDGLASGSESRSTLVDGAVDHVLGSWRPQCLRRDLALALGRVAPNLHCMGRERARLAGSRTVSLKTLAITKSMSSGNTSSVRASSIAMLRAALTGYVASICSASRDHSCLADSARRVQAIGSPKQETTSPQAPDAWHVMCIFRSWLTETQTANTRRLGFASTELTRGAAVTAPRFNLFQANGYKPLSLPCPAIAAAQVPRSGFTAAPGRTHSIGLVRALA